MGDNPNACTRCAEYATEIQRLDAEIERLRGAINLALPAMSPVYGEYDEMADDRPCEPPSRDDLERAISILRAALDREG